MRFLPPARHPARIGPAFALLLLALLAGCARVGDGTASPPPPTTTPAATTAQAAASPSPAATIAPPGASPTVPTSTPKTATATATTPPGPSQTEAAIPRIASFTLTPDDALAVGSSVSVAWEASGERASLCFIGAQPAGCREVPLTGSTTVAIEEETLAYDRLGLQVSVGEDFIWSFVDLHFQCPTDWFFANPPERCPAGAPILSPAAAQYFEHGFMVWTETPDRFYVFFDEGHEYVTLDAPYTTVTPGPLAATPPPGCYEPVSGFGQLWRGELQGVDAADVRERLGWATAPEFAFDTAQQCEVTSHPHLWWCFLRGPDGRVLSLHPDSSGQVRFLWDWW